MTPFEKERTRYSKEGKPRRHCLVDYSISPENKFSVFNKSNSSLVQSKCQSVGMFRVSWRELTGINNKWNPFVNFKRVYNKTNRKGSRCVLFCRGQSKHKGQDGKEEFINSGWHFDTRSLSSFPHSRSHSFQFSKACPRFYFKMGVWSHQTPYWSLNLWEHGIWRGRLISGNERTHGI